MYGNQTFNRDLRVVYEMIKIYRVVLTDGNKWVVRATSKAQARSAAMVKCKDLDNFGVHIDKIEEVKDPDRV